MNDTTTGAATRIESTLTIRAAHRGRWDAIVIGAGPAGALAAYVLARRNVRVLLVDRSGFPRPKVCGCCLNSAALASLEANGLGQVTQRLRAEPLRDVHIAARGVSAALRLPGGVALSRAALDAALVRSAIHAGASFLSPTSASVTSLSNGHRHVRLSGDDGESEAAARVVLVADGLAGRSVRALPEFERVAADDARIGAGVMLDDGPAFYQPGSIYMACGRGGYVGLVRLEGGRLNVAVAFDAACVRRSAGVGAAAIQILSEAGFPADAGLATAGWRGTAPLTCRRNRLASERVFLIGDATGYVEPFTGEGMAWAFASATAVAPFALAAARTWSHALAGRWERRHRHLFQRRRRQCRLLTVLLRWPLLTRLGISVIGGLPWLAGPYVKSINRHPTSTATPESTSLDIGK